MTSLGKFVNQIEAFIDVLMETFPEVKDFQIFNEKFKMLRGINPRLILDSFVMFVLPYKKYIVAKNEEFFLNLDNLDTHIEKTKQDDIFNKALNFKNIWEKKMTKQHRDTVWKYFGVFIVLAERANAERSSSAMK
jgi:hypothetical protein